MLEMMPRTSVVRQAMKETLHIALLGPPALMSGSQPVSIVRRQSRALLYRIAASPHPVSRDHLYFLLWPDVPQATARRNLTVLLTPLRHALSSPDALVLSDDTIGIHPTRVVVDITQSAAVETQALSHARLAALANALKLYRGPFLDGFALPAAVEFSTWVDQER